MKKLIIPAALAIAFSFGASARAQNLGNYGNYGDRNQKDCDPDPVSAPETSSVVMLSCGVLALLGLAAARKKFATEQ